ncbi:hypothetical protein FHU33_0707 [Blastococcus colisei]|uniref:Trypsin-like peptidase n=1 Tax=Blastococcus colisei TaxID=1564162 RepID=A0A543PBF5_9ACTN|nr:hypothetical protein [Blastococcus colisei]TQN41340.1 hypothetical protein FHU33_0707 [Blastococcus colisei]
MDPDAARELKARILERLPSAVEASSAPGERDAPWPWVAVGLSPTSAGARVAVRLQRNGDRALLPDLGRVAAEEVDVKVIGPVRSLSSPGELQRRVRPLRPGLSVAHASVTAGTLGGFVRTASGLAILSNNHVLAASNAASAGDAVLQPGPSDGGRTADRVATLTGFQPMAAGVNLVDAAVAALDEDVDVAPGDLPGGPLLATVPARLDVDPDEAVEKIGRTTGHTRGRITAVEVDGVAVQYDALSSPQGIYRFDDQIEIEGRSGAFSAGGDSGSVIWRSRDRAPVALLFAGSETGGAAGTGVTFANPLSTVLAILDVEWCEDRPPPTGRTLASGS